MQIGREIDQPGLQRVFPSAAPGVFDQHACAIPAVLGARRVRLRDGGDHGDEGETKQRLDPDEAVMLCSIIMRSGFPKFVFDVDFFATAGILLGAFESPWSGVWKICGAARIELSLHNKHSV